MQLEKQVVSLELAKRLKELGVKQNSIWWWYRWTKNHNWKLSLGTEEMLNYSFRPDDIYSAFTIAELFEPLSDGEIIKYVVENDNWDGSDYIKLFRDPDNLAECLIWLIENKKKE